MLGNGGAGSAYADNRHVELLQNVVDGAERVALAVVESGEVGCPPPRHRFGRGEKAERTRHHDGVDQVAEERARAEARDRLRSRATRAERDDFLRRLAELTGGPPTPELVQWAEEFLSKPAECGVAQRKAS